MINKDVIYFVASIIGISSFFLTDMLLLRSVYLVSSCLFILSGIIFQLDIIIIMNMFYALVNAYQIILLMRQRSTHDVPPYLRITYQKIFRTMSPYEFNYLLKLAKRVKVSKPTLLFQKDTQPKKLLFVYKGDINILLPKNKTITLKKRSFIGEFSYLTGHPISTSVKTAGPVRYLQWSFTTLNKLQKTNKDIYMKLLAIISRDLVDKINR